MEKNGWAQKKYLVDGFPRNQDNLQGWTEEMGELVETPAVLFFHADEAVLRERILKRSQNSGRNDDNEETLRKRLAVFENETMPIINHFDALGKVKKIDGTLEEEVVYKNVLSLLNLDEPPV
mmetsp:Transcript_11713/g.8549  ORF Transcript_11713/g.8549 Transcript_11713/m.8549 type:complete len:122 (-) Transcript_11713:40-405(-)